MILLLLCSGVYQSVAIADDYPNRPLTIVVAFGVGGSTDRMARAISRYLGEELGQPVQVINKKGAGTLLGLKYLLDRSNEGYDILSSGFSPYLVNVVLEGNADFTVDDFAYLNFQWFDEDLIALSDRSEFRNLGQLIEAIRNKPGTVRGGVVRGSGGHLIAKMLLSENGIPQENLNLVAYNDGAKPRAAVAGGVIDFIIISAQGTESIKDYITPVAVMSAKRNPVWDAPTVAEALAPLGMSIPLLPGTIRGFAVSAAFKEAYPERFQILSDAMRRALANPELQTLLEKSSIGARWTGPQASTETMSRTFEIFRDYSHLLRLE
jgi:tripartite-type tricarboxylate transporter receptor subunit TctC